MSSSLATKSILGLLGASAAGGTAAAGYKLLKKNGDMKEKPMTIQKHTVAKLLEQDKTKQLLDAKLEGSNEDWKAAYEKYRTGESSKDANPWQMPDWNNKKSQSGQNAPTEFISKFSEESKKEVVDDKDPIYVNVSTWCTKTITPT
ncbi:hypothetical protein HF1_11810 [Mycoplasma haemofelis str. Langford 1]|uniref:Uncharacterized protein n=1 Tax=Mycoplasma haemofelis (strain Langford 1) TaxID=941640 RepID=E8ZJ68_MYCHL|nr:hypothetical protein [Mycoplasma haemofelis]CBY93189.1 hypothetical protein HF1_11810 [Mycoplasma haemofelis str. Langford 1]